MADDWNDFIDDLFEPDPRDYEQILFGNSREVDPAAQTLFLVWMDVGMKADTEEYRALVDYMWEAYQIDFEDVFEWEDFQEWYDSQ